jgi:type I restriction enzyme S subunit
MQVDIGFGNAIEPPPTETDYPSLLDLPLPRIRAYPQEAVIAEKLHAMVVLGERNTRYKDFYDLYAFARQFSFDGERLTTAIATTFERRRTTVELALPAALAPRFYADGERAARWRTYLASRSLPGAPADWAAVGELLQAFLAEPWRAIADGREFSDRWSPGGPWAFSVIEGPAVAKTLCRAFQQFRSYPAYKDSGVEWLGEIPAHWKATKVKRVCRFAYGDSLTSELRQDGDVEVYGSNGPVGAHDRTNTLAPCLIIGRKGSFGKVNYSVRPVFAIDTTFFVDRRSTCTNIRWLYYVLSDARLDAATKDSAIPGLDQEDAYSRDVCVCPEEEQRTIAAFLDGKVAQIDALVARKERLIELLREKRIASITRAVTKGLDPNASMKNSGIEWIGKIPAHWEIRSLKWLFANLDSRRVPLSGEERAAMTKEYPYYGASGVIDHVESYLFDEPLILVAEDGANLYSRSTPLAFVAAGKYWVNNHAHILRPLDGMVDYWAHVLGCIVFDPWISGSAQPKLTSENLGSILLPVPPGCERKQILAFADCHATELGRVMAKASEAIDRLKELRAALISAAVTGKIDVREHAS